MRTFAVGAALAGLILGCSSSPTSPDQARFSVSLSLSSTTVALGEPVDWTIVVANQGSAAGRLDFMSACQANFVVEGASGVIWNDQWATTCAAVLTHVDLGAGETATYRGRWRQQTASGYADTGSYRLRGELLTSPLLASGGVPLAIQPSP